MYHCWGTITFTSYAPYNFLPAPASSKKKPAPVSSKKNRLRLPNTCMYIWITNCLYRTICKKIFINILLQFKYFCAYLLFMYLVNFKPLKEWRNKEKITCFKEWFIIKYNHKSKHKYKNIYPEIFVWVIFNIEYSIV